jgi:ATP-dependent RNA helicase DHX29
VSLAQRVSRELGDSAGAVGTLSSLVGYSIRLESNTTRNTRLAFVTNGIALRMLEGGTGPNGQGTAFDEITHIIIDEVHERSIESDFLLIVLKSLLSQRSDLKIILMSATVDADKLSNYFNGCPTLHVPGRTFPVDVRFLEDAIEYANWSIQENSPYAINLHDKSHKNRNRFEWDEDTVYGNDDEETLVEGGHQISSQSMRLEKRYSYQTINTVNLLDERAIPYELILRLLERLCFEDKESHHSSAVLIFMPGLGEIRRMNDLLTEHHAFGDENSFRLYPLHSTLSSDNQSAVFDVPPQGVRKIVIATNIAETGITIPDITCVIDTGKHREMRFDEKRQLSRLVETFVAKSNAAQRRGRAGRVQNGLCFHLFTKIRHDTLLADHPLPEMMRLSLSDLALRIKIMKVKIGTSIEDVLSRALDPPTPVNVQRAISALVEVRALTPSEDITPMGRLLSMLPTDVHLGKFLLTAVLFRCLDPALTIAAALSSKSPFIVPMGMEQEADRAKSSFRVDNSDFLTIHNAFSSWRRASENPSFVRKFCRVNFLSHQNLQQIEELRQQFLGFLVDSSFITVDRSFVRELSRARFGRNRTRFVNVPPFLDSNGSNIALINSALTAGLYPKVLAIDSSSGQMRTISNNQSAAFHPTSVNFGRKPADFGVNHLVYFTLMHSKKMYAWETGPIDDLAIVLLCGESEFKVHSNMLSIDRKIRYQLAPKANVALKILRQHLTAILALQLRGKPLTESQVLWYDLATAALGKMKLETGDDSTKLMIKLP